MTAFFIFDRQSSRGWIKPLLGFPLDPLQFIPTCLDQVVLLQLKTLQWLLSILFMEHKGLVNDLEVFHYLVLASLSHLMSYVSFPHPSF